MDNEIFKDTLQGLQDALEYINGDKTKGRSHIVTVPNVMPVKEYTNTDIKKFRTERQMTQKIFAEVIGVSQKTVEAWETGTNKPVGAVFRLLQLIEADNDILKNVLIEG